MCEDENDEQYVQRIARMNMPELLAEILSNAEYLTDRYYREFSLAMQKRGDELLAVSQKGVDMTTTYRQEMTIYREALREIEGYGPGVLRADDAIEIATEALKEARKLRDKDSGRRD